MSTKNLENYSLWTALITPFKEDLSLDREGLQNIVKEQEQAGNALLILGSTGEALNMPLEQQKELLTAVIEMKPKVPIMVGVGGSCLPDTISWVKYLNTLAIDAMLMVTPLYAKPESEGQYEWFKSLLDCSQRPVMLYNVPGRTGKKMGPDVVRRLNGHENFWALKEASGSIEDYTQFRKASADMALMSGDDGLIPSFAKVGCQGLVSVASNAWPAATNLYVKKALANELSEEEISLWDACASALFCVSNPIPVKRLLAEEKRIGHPFCLLPLTHKDLNQAATVLEASQRINDWYKKNNSK